MSKTALLMAITIIHRPEVGAEKEDGKALPVEVIQPGRCFEPEDDKQGAELIRLGAAREATKDEVAVEKDRQEREKEMAAVSVIAPANGTGKATKAVKAGGTGSAPTGQSSTGGSTNADLL